MKKQYILAAVSILCWSTVATVVKLLLGSYTSMQVLCVSALFGAVFLLCINVATGAIKKLKEYKPRDYLLTVLIGLPGAFLYYIFYYTGTSMMLASQAFIINYLWPIMSVVFACIILGEKMTARKAIAIVLSFIGVFVVTGKDILHFDTTTLMGAAFCLSAAVSYGIYTALNQKAKYDKRISLMFFYFTAFILTSIINILTDGFPQMGIVEVLGFAWNGVFTMAVADSCWMLALKSGKTAKISNLAYITPFLSLIWTAIFLEEKVSWLSILGLAIIVGGILIQATDKSEDCIKSPKKEEDNENTTA